MTSSDPNTDARRIAEIAETAYERLPDNHVGTCPFCAILCGQAPADMIAQWPDAIAIIPLNPVVTGHMLVIPSVHVTDFVTDPNVTARTVARAAEITAAMVPRSWNLITSRGRDATQSVRHLHVHLVPRRPDDGLQLPWGTNDR